jgi:hypothetical protein
MKIIRRSSGFVLGLLWLLIADFATAGSYTLVVGKGIGEENKRCQEPLFRSRHELRGVYGATVARHPAISSITC